MIPQVAVAVFAIPTGIFGAGFEDMIQHRKQGKQQQQQGQQEPAPRLDSMSSDMGGDTSAGGVGGSGSPVEGYFTLAPPAEDSAGDNSVDVYGDGGGTGSSAGAGAGAGWVLLGGGGGVQEGGEKALGGDRYCCGGGGCFDGAGGLSFLDTGTSRGAAYRTFLFAIVVLDILAFFASTTFYLQVRGTKKRGAEGPRDQRAGQESGDRQHGWRRFLRCLLRVCPLRVLVVSCVRDASRGRGAKRDPCVFLKGVRVCVRHC